MKQNTKNLKKKAKKNFERCNFYCFSSMLAYMTVYNTHSITVLINSYIYLGICMHTLYLVMLLSLFSRSNSY